MIKKKIIKKRKEKNFESRRYEFQTKASSLTVTSDSCHRTPVEHCVIS